MLVLSNRLQSRLKCNFGFQPVMVNRTSFRFEIASHSGPYIEAIPHPPFNPPHPFRSIPFIHQNRESTVNRLQTLSLSLTDPLCNNPF